MHQRIQVVDVAEAFRRVRLAPRKPPGSGTMKFVEWLTAIFCSRSHCAPPRTGARRRKRTVGQLRELEIRLPAHSRFPLHELPAFRVAHPHRVAESPAVLPTAFSSSSV